MFDIAGFDNGGKADAVMPSRRARPVAPASEIVDAPITNGDLHGAG